MARRERERRGGGRGQGHRSPLQPLEARRGRRFALGGILARGIRQGLTWSGLRKRRRLRVVRGGPKQKFGVAGSAPRLWHTLLALRCRRRRRGQHRIDRHETRAKQERHHDAEEQARAIVARLRQRPSPNPPLPERPWPERPLPERTLPERTLPERTLPERTLPEGSLG